MADSDIRNDKSLAPPFASMLWEGGPRELVRATQAAKRAAEAIWRKAEFPSEKDGESEAAPDGSAVDAAPESYEPSEDEIARSLF